MFFLLDEVLDEVEKGALSLRVFAALILLEFPNGSGWGGVLFATESA